MAEFNVRSDSVNVEQIMEQLRARIREKRGVDYTEQQIRELAAVKLEKFLDPRGVRSDLLEQFRKAQPAYEPPELPNFAFEDATLFESHRAPIRWIRKLLLPILKLFFNPNPLIQALHIQSRLNTLNAEREARREATRRQLDQLYYELIHNLVIETTRLGIDVKNLKMRLESVSSRLEFNERRARALESAVVYKPGGADVDRPQRQQPHYQQQQQPQQQPPPRAQTPPQQQQPPPRVQTPPQQTSYAAVTSVTPPADGSAAAPTQQGQTGGQQQSGEGPGQRSRRRRRRRGRRGGASAAAIMGAPGAPSAPDTTGTTAGDAASVAEAEGTDAFDGGDDGEEASPPAAAEHAEPHHEPADADQRPPTAGGHSGEPDTQ